MKLTYTIHWQRKRKYRPDISDDLIEYVILHSPIMRDKHWNDAFNALARVHSSGRMLKVVYKRNKSESKIITAYWID